MPNVYIIAGPNGAGKTTFAREFLPIYANCTNFVNADLIAGGLSPLLPQAAAFRAGRLVLDEIERFSGNGDDFAFETTLSGRSYMNVIRSLKKRDYAVHLVYLWVPDSDVAMSRISLRVMQGGHDVPERDVRRRFERSARNLFQHYLPLADRWILIDNSEIDPQTIAFQLGGNLHIINTALYRELRSRYTSS